MLLMFFLAFAAVGLWAFGMECADNGWKFTSFAMYAWSIIALMTALSVAAEYTW